MMYKAIIFAAAVAVAVVGEESAGSACVASTFFQIECNICRCSNDGSKFICTKLACPPVTTEVDISSFPTDGSCLPSQSFRYYCNSCTCSTAGIGAACTRMNCPPGLFNKDGTINTPQGKPVPRDYSAVSEQFPELPEDGSCEAGKSYKKACNTCNCLQNGQAVCTQKFCGISNVLRSDSTESNWGPFYEQGTPCEPHTLFYSECNQCTCLADGNHAACTLKACPAPPSQE